jgi:integron integrase
MKKTEALQKFYEVMRLQRKSRKTIRAYIGCVAKYIDHIALSNYPTREERIGKFLSHLVIKYNVSASSQKIYLNAIKRFYEWVFKEDIGKLVFDHSTKPQYIPVVLSREETWAVLDRLTGVGWLWGALMYGCGLRLDETCSLRIMDIDLDRKQVHIHLGKGAKDRIVPLPELLIDPLKKHLRILFEVHKRYAARRIPVLLPDALDKKYPQAPYSWPWFWLFPASGPIQNKSKDPKMRSTTPLLCHVHHSAVQRRIGRAIKAAHIPKKATCHTLRHSFATHWLENSEGSHEIAIIRLQKLLGHSKPETTMIYLHCVKQKTDVPSPLDTLPERVAA